MLLGGCTVRCAKSRLFCGRSLWQWIILVNIVWVRPVLPGTSADVKAWDKYGPQRTKGYCMEFEVGIHDGAYKGRLHSHVPFMATRH